MPELEQAGNFRGQIINYGVTEKDSGAVAVSIEVAIEDIYHEGEWHDWREHGFTVHGDVWVIKKDGTLNKSGAESLINNAGWDGSFQSVANGQWRPEPVAVVVNRDEYKDNVRFRAAFVNAYDSTPGGGGNVSPEDAKALDGKLGAQLRGLAGNKSRNAAKPSGKPGKATPAPAKPSPNDELQQEAAASDEIPF